MTHEMILCRAQLEDDCYDGSPASRQFGEEGVGMEEDGTYLAEGNYANTIICDACYVRLMPLTPSGAGLTHELHPAINRYHAEHPRERYPLVRS